MMQHWLAALVGIFLISCVAAILIIGIQSSIDIYYAWLARRVRKNQMRLECMIGGCNRYWYVDTKDALDVKQAVALLQEHQAKDHAPKKSECRHIYRFMYRRWGSYIWQCRSCGEGCHVDPEVFWKPQRKDWRFPLAG